MSPSSTYFRSVIGHYLVEVLQMRVSFYLEILERLDDYVLLVLLLVVSFLRRFWRFDDIGVFVSVGRLRYTRFESEVWREVKRNFRGLIIGASMAQRLWTYRGRNTHHRMMFLIRDVCVCVSSEGEEDRRGDLQSR